MAVLRDKVAIVKGSANGIGKEITLTFAKEGEKVVIADYNVEALNEIVKEINDSGFTAFGLQVNVSEQEAVENMIQQAIDPFEKVDILVNNAGVGDQMQAAANVENATWERVMNINKNGVMYGIRSISKHFEQTGGGPIINRSSLSGVQGGRDGFTYTAAKHAFVGMTKNVASHYSPLNIRCNAIARGNVETPFAKNNFTNIDQFGMQQALRVVDMMTKSATPDEIANIALFLASEQATILNGVVIQADGGWSAY